MNNPVLWLCLSFVLVSVSLTAVFVVLVPAIVELSRAARSFEKLCNTLDRDLPPTLESLRQTTAEIAQLTDDVNAGVQNAGRVAQQVDQSVSTVRSQAQRAQVNTRSLMAGLGAAWTTFHQSAPARDRPPHPETTTPKSTQRHPSTPIEPPPPASLNSPVDVPAQLNEPAIGNRHESDRARTSSSQETQVNNDLPSQATPD